MVKKGAMLISVFPTAFYPDVWKGQFTEIARAGKGYMVIASFEEYWTPAVSTQFEFIGTPEEYNVWVASDPLRLKIEDMEFGTALRLEFLTGQSQVVLDNATYRLVSESFKYAEIALLRGDLPQAKTELENMALMPPVWTQEAKDYFINKINTYLQI